MKSSFQSVVLRHWEEAGVLEALLSLRNLCMYLTLLVGKIALPLTPTVFQKNIGSTIINTMKIYFKAFTEFTGILVIVFFF